MDNAERLRQIKSRVEAAKTERTKAEANMESLQKQRDQVVADCTAHGVTPETLDESIQTLEAQLQRNLDEAEQLLQGA